MNLSIWFYFYEIDCFIFESLLWFYEIIFKACKNFWNSSFDTNFWKILNLLILQHIKISIKYIYMPILTLLMKSVILLYFFWNWSTIQWKPYIFCCACLLISDFNFGFIKSKSIKSISSESSPIKSSKGAKDFDF